MGAEYSTGKQSRSRLHDLQAVLLPAAPSIVTGGGTHTQMPYAEALIAEVTYLCKLPVEVTLPRVTPVFVHLQGTQAHVLGLLQYPK